MRIPIVAQLMRIAWHTVDQICERVVAEPQLEVDLLAGLKRIGIQPSWEGAARLVDPHYGAEEKRRHRGGSIPESSEATKDDTVRPVGVGAASSSVRAGQIPQQAPQHLSGSVSPAESPLILLTGDLQGNLPQWPDLAGRRKQPEAPW